MICGSSRKTVETVKAGLRRRILELVEDRPAKSEPATKRPESCRLRYGEMASLIALTFGSRPVQSLCASTPW